MKKIIIYIILIIGSDAVADCNFQTAKYINELNSPKYIENIIVEVPKSGKFSKNFIKILISREPRQNIPPKLRKYFKAKITINYKFGKCSYKGKVKQNGDWKDHIKFEGGRPVRSLIVKLEEGNIVNAVKFKLLIPETRNNLHEILGTIVLQNLGYISPLTFQVNTEVNGTEQTMIFQEDSRKELLERSKRRDGPLFEGDESLLWSYKDFKTMTLGNLALSRFTNKKWFLNGDNAQNQVLSAYSLLQRAYLDRPSGNIIKLNNEASKTFEEYFFIVLSMNGEHGLRLHNRKFYFNSFLNEFEPVYYDGNLNLHEKIDLKHINLNEAFKNKSYEDLIVNLSNLEFYSKCYNDFFDRVIIEDNEARIFFEKAFSQISFNASFLQNKLSKLEELNSVFSKSNVNYEKYIENSNNSGVQQEIIFELEKLDSNFIGRLVDKKDLTLKPHDVVSIISDHKFQDRRFLFLPKNDSQLIPKLVVKNLDKYGGKIIHSETLSVDIDTEIKLILLTQNNSTDFALLKDIKLRDWTIKFLGKNNNDSLDNLTPERINKFGLTGCLNFFNTKLDKVIINASFGKCEDTINIVNSSGNIKNVYVVSAFSDALDLDFSNLEIKKVYVRNAGNDCIDVSGGFYSIENAQLSNCGDKGLSVGEKSVLIASDINLENSLVGASSKDFSRLVVKNSEFKSTKICLEANQKKQEFGGSLVKFSNFSCEGEFNIDDHSIFLN